MIVAATPLDANTCRMPAISVRLRTRRSSRLIGSPGQDLNPLGVVSAAAHPHSKHVLPTGRTFGAARAATSDPAARQRPRAATNTRSCPGRCCCCSPAATTLSSIVAARLDRREVTGLIAPARYIHGARLQGRRTLDQSSYSVGNTGAHDVTIRRADRHAALPRPRRPMLISASAARNTMIDPDRRPRTRLPCVALAGNRHLRRRRSGGGRRRQGIADRVIAVPARGRRQNRRRESRGRVRRPEASA